MAKRVITSPWASVSGDAMGYYPRTAKGKSYLLDFTDTFTKWVELVPVRVINGKIPTREIRETISFTKEAHFFLNRPNKDVTKLLSTG